MSFYVLEHIYNPKRTPYLRMDAPMHLSDANDDNPVIFSQAMTRLKKPDMLDFQHQSNALISQSMKQVIESVSAQGLSWYPAHILISDDQLIKDYWVLENSTKLKAWYDPDKSNITLDRHGYIKKVSSFHISDTFALHCSDNDVCLYQHSPVCPILVNEQLAKAIIDAKLSGTAILLQADWKADMQTNAIESKRITHL